MDLSLQPEAWPEVKETEQISEHEAGVPQVSAGPLRTTLRTDLVGHVFWWGEATISSTASLKGQGTLV